MVLRPRLRSARAGALAARGVLVGAADLSVGSLALLPGEGWHPLVVLASLLPLQLAALLRALSQRRA